MPDGVAKTGDQGKSRFNRENVEDSENPAFQASQSFRLHGV